VWKLVYGDRKRFDGPSKRVRPETAAKILAVELDLADGATIQAAGTRRRIQALVCLGYSVSHLANRLDITPSNFHKTLHDAVTVKVGTAKAVAALYDELSMTPNVATDQRGKIARSRALSYSARRGWVPPLAWCDDTIDDPFMEPEGVELLPHTRTEIDEVAVQRVIDGDRTVALTKPERHEVARRWVASGRSLAEMERVTGLNTGRYVEKRTA